MIQTTARIGGPPVWLGTLFTRILCGVDGTESSDAAVQQAIRLLSARSMLELLSVVEQSAGQWPELPRSADLERRYEDAQHALGRARALCPRARAAILCGDPGQMLASAARGADATLVAVGAPATGRLGGSVLGSVGTHVLHNAPCSVLIARRPADGAAFPRSIVVGHDGSKGAAAACAVAQELSDRFAATLRVLVADGADSVQINRLALHDELEWSSLQPTAALVGASAEADLVVVGSRGLRGLRALGSVSERVGHLALCSVLVVREPSGLHAAGRDDDAVPDGEC